MPKETHLDQNANNVGKGYAKAVTKRSSAQGEFTVSRVYGSGYEGEGVDIHGSS